MDSNAIGPIVADGPMSIVEHAYAASLHDNMSFVSCYEYHKVLP